MFEKMLEQMAGGGWSELDNAEANFRKASEQQSAAETAEIERQAAIVAKALESEDGKLLFDLLMRMTLLRQPDEMERALPTTAETYAIAKAKREGQNQIMFWLLARLQHFHGKKAEQPGGGL